MKAVSLVTAVRMMKTYDSYWWVTLGHACGKEFPTEMEAKRDWEDYARDKGIENWSWDE